MSDHPEVPRVEFYGNGQSMNIEEAVSLFRVMLREREDQMNRAEEDSYEFVLRAEIRPCDCNSNIRGRDEYCALHGGKE